MTKMEKIFEQSKTIAVVGLSSNPARPSYMVARYLQSQGYKIIPVNPNEKEILGEKSYPDLVSIPDKIDIVDIFRRSEEVPPVVEQAIKIKAKVVWMQEGIVNEESAKKASDAGLTVIMDKCMYKEHSKYRPNY
ncbi:MAG: CoA-binding protein [candidate division Zixibacteria bacterium]|nr:CoA-binding protein [candidate division Zixibacteria bacterium]